MPAFFLYRYRNPLCFQEAAVCGDVFFLETILPLHFLQQGIGRVLHGKRRHFVWP